MFLFQKRSPKPTSSGRPAFSSLAKSVGPPPLSEDAPVGISSTFQPQSMEAVGRAVPVLKVDSSPKPSFRPVTSIEDPFECSTPPSSPSTLKLVSTSPSDVSTATATTMDTCMSPSYLSAASSPSFRSPSEFLSPTSTSYLMSPTVPSTPRSSSRSSSRSSKRSSASSLTSPKTPSSNRQRRSPSKQMAPSTELKTPSKRPPRAPELKSPSKRPPRSPEFNSPSKRSPRSSEDEPPPDEETEREPGFLMKKERHKTELCRHFEKNGRCPFGLKCTYAHGVEELQQKTIHEMHREGVVEDVKAFRTLPCMLWVSTGSCPFGKRCSSIHDQRVKGSIMCWLPVTETQGNYLDTDINVDGLYQKRQHSIQQSNPFGNNFSLKSDGWTDLYDLVCNIPSSSNMSGTFTEAHKLAIALKMRGGSSWTYKFQPTHILYGELECMVLQERAFKTLETNEIWEIPTYELDPHKATHIMVREIAFGPDSDPSVRGVALYFDIPKGCIEWNTKRDPKSYRWFKKTENPMSLSSMLLNATESFSMIRPYDHDAYELATDMLKNRLMTCISENIKNIGVRSLALQERANEKLELERRFLSQRRHWMTWAWPINMGLQYVNESTPVPLVDSNYIPMPDEQITEDEGGDKFPNSTMGIVAKKIWDSFLTTELELLPVPQCRPVSSWTKPAAAPKRQRLSIFVKLADGTPISPDRTLPHIRECFFEPTKVDLAQQRVSEHGWKATLLKEPLKDPFGEDLLDDEWEAVRRFFATQDEGKAMQLLMMLQE